MKKQGKENLFAPWLGLTAFFVVSTLLTLLVFAGEAFRDALGKLSLNDASLFFEPENSEAMGFGFRATASAPC